MFEYFHMLMLALRCSYVHVFLWIEALVILGSSQRNSVMTNRPPAPGTYDPRDWKCPNCKTLNFKKRKNCLSCATERPPQTREQVMPDWRTGKKDCGANINADWTCRPCGRFNLACDRFCLACTKDDHLGILFFRMLWAHHLCVSALVLRGYLRGHFFFLLWPPR